MENPRSPRATDVQPAGISHDQWPVQTVMDAEGSNGIWRNLRVQPHLVKKAAWGHFGEQGKKHRYSKQQGHYPQSAPQGVLHSPTPRAARFACAARVEASKARVSACPLPAMMSAVGPCSTIWPCAMTAILSARRATSDISCEISGYGGERDCWRSRSRFYDLRFSGKVQSGERLIQNQQLGSTRTRAGASNR